MTPSAHSDHQEISKRRHAAFLRSQRHSRNVVFMRRAFPIMAVLLLGVYFLDSGISLQFSDMEASVEKIELSKDELKMINPRLEGHDEKSGSYVMTADHATQKLTNTNIVNLQIINGTLVHPQNGTITLKADRGVFNSQKEIMDLAGNIVVTTQNGMTGYLQSANIKIKSQRIASDKPVFVEMKSGSVRSQKMIINGLDKTLTFIGNVRVKLLKNPDKKLLSTAKDQNE